MRRLQQQGRPNTAGASRAPAAPRARTRLLAAAVLALGLAGGAQAAALDQLRQFLSETKTASGEFTQRVVGPNARIGAAPQDSSGRFVFQRPGRFRWSYEKPYEQLLVADGERLYLYDKDLNQVTVKKIAAALPASPASILFGASDFERDFEVKDDGVRDGLEWLDARPRAKDSPFERIRIGFREGLPMAMQLSDTFGQTSSLRFSKIERNPKVDPKLFQFTPPAGADVLEDK